MAHTKIKFRFSLGNAPLDSPKTIIRVYGVTNHQPILLNELIINGSQIKLCINTAKFKFFYIVVNINICKCGKTSLDLITVFRNDATKVFVNEQTTVANIFCFSRFLKIYKHPIILCGKNDLLEIAYQMRNNFICVDGVISSIIQSNPNGLETNSFPLFNYLANLIFYTFAKKQIRRKFLVLSKAKTVISGIFNLARHPFRNVTQIYRLIENRKAIYVPALNTITLPSWKTPIPNQWTLTIKINKTGSKNFIIGGPGYIVFDKNDRAWLNNNTRQGTPNSSTFCTIVESNGQPVSFSPLFGGGLLGAGFGIAISNDKNKIAIGNFGWGTTDYNPQDGSISLIQSDGCILSPANGFTNGFKRAQGLYYDNQGNLWISAWGSQTPLGSIGGDNTFDFASANSAVVVYINGNPNDFAVFEFENENFGTFDVVADEQDNIYVSNAGNKSANVKSSVFHFRLVNKKIIKINSWVSDKVEAFRQITVSPSGYVFVAAVITDRVLKFDKQLNLISSLTKNMDGPWGLEFDSTGTLYVANFRQDTEVINNNTFDMNGRFGITVVHNEDNCTAKLFTLPTGGAEVMLDNGFPLYGSNSKPSYEPLMRLTGTKIDRIGNVWVVNNWKPALMTDFGGNPGGDGAVIFVGLAETFNCK